MEFFESHFKNKGELIEMFNDIEGENIDENNKNYPMVIESFVDAIFKFSSLSFALIESGNFKTKKQFYTNGYLMSITNNFLSIKSTFSSGFHFQLQSLIRSQFEQLNILLSFLYDDNFFERFTKKIENREKILTPKLKDSEKTIKKIFSSQFNISKKDTNTLTPLFNDTYNRLSEAAHGNLQRVTLHSMEANTEDSMTFALGGTHKINYETIEFISDINNYSQIVWSMVKNKLYEKDYLNGSQSKKHLEISENPFFLDYKGEYLDYEQLKKELKK